MNFCSAEIKDTEGDAEGVSVYGAMVGICGVVGIGVLVGLSDRVGLPVIVGACEMEGALEGMALTVGEELGMSLGAALGIGDTEGFSVGGIVFGVGVAGATEGDGLDLNEGAVLNG